MSNGHWGRLLRVDLTTRKVTTETIAPATLRKYLGGVGLAARLLYDETDATTEPLSPENPLIFAVGPLPARASP